MCRQCGIQRRPKVSDLRVRGDLRIPGAWTQHDQVVPVHVVGLVEAPHFHR